MLDVPDYATRDLAWLRDLLTRRPWATIVAAPDGVPTATHMPVLLENAGGDGGDEALTLVTHLGVPDDETLGLADGVQVLVVVEGASGYVTPTWYAWGPAVPTWNVEVAHLTASVELLDDAGTWDVLVRTVAAFESARPEPFVLAADDLAYARRLARGVRGVRLHVTDWRGKNKMSQDKPAAVVARIVAGLEDPADVHADPALAAAMRAVHPDLP
ncbi:FMN-binding negative transcriptional regulator [Litorihabitans aurantiacus]|uniref:Transcriptional regulator n=1 Tax=Litorihabitans aurantiacus TaxID=1930061 RepID=A0AA38CV46_9MICO|nr:FMN-binding negative transcriptional regulator [Litorihabitans aurantiacus]GMA33264.1 transcriptional regulator [Litorihabitans aurantiacus]